MANDSSNSVLVEFDENSYDNCLLYPSDGDYFDELIEVSTQKCSACFGTGLDRDFDVDCIVCWGDGYL